MTKVRGDALVVFKAKKKYLLYGVVIGLPFTFSQLRESDSDPDVVVNLGPIEHQDIRWAEEGLCHKAAPGVYFIRIQGIANYLVRNGCEIVVEMVDGADPEAVKLFLLHPVMGALLIQRDLLPLQGSCVVYKKRAFALLGASATGKSFLAAGLMKKGLKVLSDHICCVIENPHLMVTPGYPFLLLWHKGLRLLGEQNNRFARVRQGLEKYFFPLDCMAEEGVAPLCGIYLLSNWNRDGHEFDTLTGFDKMFRILDHTYHEPSVKAMGIFKWQQKIGSALAKCVPVKSYRFSAYEDRAQKSIDSLYENILAAAEK